MRSMINEYGMVIVQLIAIIGTISMLGYGCSVYKQVIEGLLAAVFYK